MKTVFLALGKITIEAVDLGDGKYANIVDIISAPQSFATKEEAQYYMFKKRVLDGTPVRNFRGSKFYDMYIERAKKENPELLI